MYINTEDMEDKLIEDNVMSQFFGELKKDEGMLGNLLCCMVVVALLSLLKPYLCVYS